MDGQGAIEAQRWTGRRALRCEVCRGTQPLMLSALQNTPMTMLLILQPICLHHASTELAVHSGGVVIVALTPALLLLAQGLLSII